MTDPLEAGDLFGVAEAAVPGFRGATVERLDPRRGKAQVFRVSEGPGGRSLVLKLQAEGACRLEAMVYQHLQGFSRESVTCHAIVPAARADTAWLVTGQVAGVAFDPVSREHAVALGRWLATLHVESQRIAERTGLPDHCADHWLATVAHARGVLAAGLDNPALDAGHRTGVGALERVLAQTVDRWDAAVDSLGSVPACLTHGDLTPRNVRLLGPDEADGEDPIPMVFDWGTAGWGSPAVDLLWVDLGAYAEASARLGHPWREASVRELPAIGGILWVSYVLHGDEVNLRSEWPNHAAAKAPHYLELLVRRGVPRPEAVSL